jgi:hypothetical protein
LIAKIITQERVNALVAALVLIGIALILVGIWRYMDAAQRLAGDDAQALLLGAASVNVETPEQTQGLVAAGVQRRRLERQQHESLILAGVGLASLGVGWLGHDLMRARRKSHASAASSPAKDGA